MSNSTTRAVALSPKDRPPPPYASRRPAASVAALQQLVTIPAIFLVGVMVGHMIGPPSPGHCSGARDAIACIIQSLD